MQIRNFKIQLFLQELLPFAIVQGLGIWIVHYLKNDPAIIASAPVSFSLFDAIFGVGMLVFLIFLARRGGKSRDVIFRILFGLAILSGTQITLAAFFEPLVASTIAFGLVIGLFMTRRVILHNIAIILALVGIGSIFALSIAPVSAVIILAAMSFYDIWAVYRTRHMIVLAEGMIQAGAIFGLVLPNTGKDLLARTADIVPGPRAMVLGSGDIVFPLFLSGAVAVNSLTNAVIIASFSALGLFVTHLLFVNQSERRPMAALPPIATATILGYLVVTAINTIL